MTNRPLTFTIVAPAGFATDPPAVERAILRLEALGHRVTCDATAAEVAGNIRARRDREQDARHPGGGSIRLGVERA